MATHTKTGGNRPEFNVLAAPEGTDRLLKIGAAWPLRDKPGYSLKIDALPRKWDGRLVLLPNIPKGADAEAVPLGEL